LTTQARLDLLERRFNRCAFRLRQAETLARDDREVLDVVASLKFALALAQQRCTEATHDPRPDGDRNYLSRQRIAWRALAAAANGDVEEAELLARKTELGTDTLLIRNVSEFALAIAAVQARGEDGLPELEKVILDCVQTGQVFSVIGAYRAWPDMLPLLLGRPSTSALIEDLLARFDPGLASAHGVDSIAPAAKRTVAGLSPREHEVLALLTEGLTNREIAKRLYIAEATAKLHVRRICGKLGVRSRTEAALAVIG
jgi:DNA-binding CsgD family transcriptional regulator